MPLVRSLAIVLLGAAALRWSEPPVSSPSAMFLVRVESDAIGERRVGFAIDRVRVAAATAGGGVAVPEGPPESAVSRAPWPAAWVEWMYLRAEGEQSNWDAVAAESGSPDLASVEVVIRDMNMVGLDLVPREEVLDATSLAVFIDARGNRIDADRAALPSTGPLRIMREESAKALFRDSSLHSGGGAVALSRGGQRAEIRPLVDPTLTGSDLVVDVMIDARRIERLRVLVTPASGGAPIVAVMDAEGSCNFGALPAGDWRVEVHVLQPAIKRDDASEGQPDWELLSATLTFSRGGGG